MAFNLSDRIGAKGRIKADTGGGFRGNTADFNSNVSMDDRAGAGSGEVDNTITGSAHSASGFKRALEHTERTQGRLSGDIVSRTHFGGKGFKKPNYFAQGQRRHGMHIGSGAPAISPAMDTGADTGGE